MATTTDGFLTSSDGTRLFFRRHAAAAPRARVLVIHGFAEHSGRYLELLDALADAGFDALAFDLRGHGRSEGRRAHLRRFEDYLDDTRAAFSALTAGTDGTALVFGHSMGGLIATHFAASVPERCRALALSSPMLARALAVNPLKLLAAHVLGRLLPVFSMPSGITGAHLTSDPDEIALHDADPLVLHQARAGWFIALEAAMAAAPAAVARLTMPLYLMHGEADPLTAFDASRALFPSAPSIDKTFVPLPGMRHETLHEVGRETVRANLVAWLAAHAAP
ncbi:MAG: lysophospholipase [Lysobacteraceae bacterium]|jgi:alpha-beta hydrolase superfamily lysophospholipase|nr:lysophospholipase [Silanimonas sp.]